MIQRSNPNTTREECNSLVQYVGPNRQHQYLLPQGQHQQLDVCETPQTRVQDPLFYNTDDVWINIETPHKDEKVINCVSSLRLPCSGRYLIEAELQYISILEGASACTKLCPWQAPIPCRFSLPHPCTATTNNPCRESYGDGNHDDDVATDVHSIDGHGHYRCDTTPPDLKFSSAFYTIQPNRLSYPLPGNGDGSDALTFKRGKKRENLHNILSSAPLLPTSPELSIPSECRLPPPIFSPVGAATGRSFSVRLPMRRENAATQQTQGEDTDNDQTNSADIDKVFGKHGIEFIEIGCQLTLPSLPSIDTPDATAMQKVPGERIALKMRRTESHDILGCVNF